MEDKFVIVGFDGFIDTIIRPIKKSNIDGDEYFETIKDFGEFISSKANVSCSIELLEEKRSFGGNMPHFAHSLARKGIAVKAIGMLGENGIKPEFKPLSDICETYSFSNEGTASCFEFDDGKVFFAPKVYMDNNIYEKISKVFDVKLFDKCHAFVLVNYSELLFSYKLWQDIYYNVFEDVDENKEKFVFFDLCDCSRKSSEEIKNVLDLIGLYSSKRTTVLSLNENEANILFNIFSVKEDENPLMSLYKKLNIDEIIVHTTKKSLIVSFGEYYFLDTLYIEKPAISTGSGDNFNASYVYGKVKGNKAEDCLKIGNFGAYIYVKTGVSADEIDMEKSI